MPDASVLNYRYDDAHRLIGIADSLGNAIAYTLDATGKRVKEQVRDLAGNLTRQTTRVFDEILPFRHTVFGWQLLRCTTALLWLKQFANSPLPNPGNGV